ncbi:MAG: hypothetical protein JRN20_04160 [Nitrososphaerota archaeon]|nr:hypothetical protein [Nitrososphaerota archaeon]MDG6923689.1 hypothetical protein [Nitrososphaerota archaeon]
MNLKKSAVSRTVTVVVVVVILVIAAAAGVYASGILGPSKSTSTSTTTLSSTSTTTSSQTTSASTTSTTKTTTSSSAAGVQNLTLEALTAPGPVGLYPLTTNTWIENLLYDPIFNYNVSNTSAVPIPWLATGYTVDPTGQYWSITLRQGVAFSDGTQFNATSLKMDIENYIIADVQSSQWNVFLRGASTYVASNLNAANQTIFKNNDGLTVTSQYVLNLNLSRPESDLLSYLAGSLAVYWSVSPSAIIANGGITVKVGNTWLLSHSAGEGPYTLQSYSSATGTLVLTANPNWWGITALNLKQPFYKVTVNVVTNPATEELDIRSGIANLIVLPVANVYDFADKTAWLTQNKLVSDVSGVNVFGPFLGSQFYMLEFNQNMYTSAGTKAASQPMQNMNLRVGIEEAWNATAFIQQDLNGFGAVNGGVMLQGQLGYQGFTTPYSYNLTASKANLQAACKQLGCSPSNPLQLTFIATNDQTAELAGSLLVSTINSMQVGITLNFVPLATSAKISTFLSKQFAISLYEQPNEPPDPLVMLSQFGTPAGTQAGPLGFVNQTIISLIAQAASTSDHNQRALLYAQIDKEIAQTANWPQVAQFENVYATSSHIHIAPFNSALLNYFPPIWAISYS